MRNRLVHGYDEIDLDVLWMVASKAAMPLIEALEAACASWPLPAPPAM
jgi:uncharacterized protein with HEPN domain